MAERIIEVVVRDEGWLEVREGDMTTGQLSWDEVIGQITSIVHPEITSLRYRMWGRCDAEVIKPG